MLIPSSPNEHFNMLIICHTEKCIEVTMSCHSAGDRFEVPFTLDLSSGYGGGHRGLKTPQAVEGGSYTSCVVNITVRNNVNKHTSGLLSV